MSNLINMLSNNLLLTIVIVLLVISEYYKNKKIENFESKLETFENEDRENFVSSTQSIDAISIKNLSTLASNLISNNGQTLKLNFSQVNFNSDGVVNFGDSKLIMKAFRGMVCPFFINYSSEKQRQILWDNYWQPCDGQKGRPDINSGRFVLGSTGGTRKKRWRI